MAAVSSSLRSPTFSFPQQGTYEISVTGNYSAGSFTSMIHVIAEGECGRGEGWGGGGGRGNLGRGGVWGGGGAASLYSLQLYYCITILKQNDSTMCYREFKKDHSSRGNFPGFKLYTDVTSKRLQLHQAMNIG